MSKSKLLAVTLIVAGIAILIIFGIVRWRNAKKPTAGLKIETHPTSLVFVDNAEKGRTPQDLQFAPREVVVKLIPESSDQSLAAYQTKVRLTDKVYSVIRRDFGKSDADSAGEIVTLQPQSSRTPSLAVITSTPDSASVTLDGEPQGFTPLLVPSLPEGDHQIVVSAPGFTPRTVSAQAIANYKLTLNVKLAALSTTQSPTPSPVEATVSGTPNPSPRPTVKAGTPSPSPKASASLSPTPSLPKPYITVLDTPTGFLRVRSGPGTGYSEMGQVKPGESYSLLKSLSDWYQISVELPATSSGWISSQYASKTE